VGAFKIGALTLMGSPVDVIVCSFGLNTFLCWFLVINMRKELKGASIRCITRGSPLKHNQVSYEHRKGSDTLLMNKSNEQRN